MYEVSTAFERLFNKVVFTKYDFSSELLCWLLTYVFIENTQGLLFIQTLSIERTRIIGQQLWKGQRSFQL